MAGTRPGNKFIDYDEIEPGLYLGNFDTATSVKTLNELKITHLVTAYFMPIKAPSHVKTFFICIGDCDKEDILMFFDDCNKFIEEGQENGACLVHCVAGISRSSSLVIAYFMKKYNLSYKEAFARVKSKRHMICPNPGFTLQLQLYETLGCHLNQSNSRGKIFFLQSISKNITKSGLSIEEHTSAIEKYSKRSALLTAGDSFKCKSCRTYLFSEANILPHVPSRTLNWKHDLPDSGCRAMCNSVLYIEVLPWMEEALKKVKGKMNCPKCKKKVGEFSWTGLSCTCGAAIVPAFKLTASKVDRDQMSILNSK